MFSLVLEVVAPEKIGAAMGVNALVIMSAAAVGPTLAGVLAGMFSWRAIFLSFAAILVVALVFVVAYCPSPYKLSKPHVDGLSVVTSVLGFGGIVFGFGMSSLVGWGSVPVIASLAICAVSLVVYCRRQLQLAEPVFNLRVFRNRGFLVGTLCVALNFGITLAVMYILPQFYQNALLIDVAVAGVIMLPGGSYSCECGSGNAYVYGGGCVRRCASRV